MQSPRDDGSWTVLAAMLGFLSGAGVMSHSEMVAVLSEDLYHFIHIAENGAIELHGREFLTIFGAIGCYMMVLVLIGVLMIRASEGSAGVRRIAAVAGMFLIASFILIAGFGISAGYDQASARVLEANRSWQAKVENAHTPLPVHWNLR